MPRRAGNGGRCTARDRFERDTHLCGRLIEIGRLRTKRFGGLPERAVQRTVGVESACRQLLEKSIPNSRCLFNGWRNGDKPALVD